VRKHRGPDFEARHWKNIALLEPLAMCASACRLISPGAFG
jgi:hypothetical protein